MAISDYSPTRDNNASIAPGDLRSNDYRRDQQIINAIRQLMADLAAPTFEAPIDVVNSSGVLLIRLSNDNNGAIEIGKVDGTTSTPYIDFHSGATFVDYDSRIIASGGSGVSGGGALEFKTADAFFSSGRIRFPAAQNASSDANTLDDYEEGTWTPVLTYATPGDLSVAYGVQLGRYQKVGHSVYVDFVISTSTHTFTTASSELRVTGLPFAAVTLSGTDWTGACQWQGITTTRSDMACSITSAQSFIRFVASGSGLSRDSMDATTNTASGTQIVLMGHVDYEAAS